jgi:hypothetical protein
MLQVLLLLLLLLLLLPAAANGFGLFGGIFTDQTAARALVPHLSGAFLSVTASAGGVRIAQERGGEGASANGAAAAAG